MSIYASYPLVGGGGVPIYANLAAFPTGSTAGQLGVAADTGILYEWNGSAWVAIAGPGSVLSVGAFGSTPNADGLSITADVLQMQPADSTHPGGLSSADWNTFNNKQPAGNYITALTGDVTASGPGSASATVAAIQGTTVSGTTGSTDVVFSASPTLTGTVNVTGNEVVSGSISAGNGVFNATSGGNGLISNSSVNVAHFDFRNTGNPGGISVGAESSTGGSLFSGSTAYAGVFGTSDNNPLQFFTHNHLVLTLDTSQNATFVGSVTANSLTLTTPLTPSNGGAAPVTRILYVDGNRTDSYTATGSFTLPFKTIGAAITQIIANNDNAAHTYNIIIAPFAYNETITLNSSTLYNLVFSNLTSANTAVQNVTVNALTSTSNNTQLATLIFNGITFGAVTLTGDTNGTNFGSTQVLFSGCQFNSGAVNLTNINNVNFYGGQTQGTASCTWTNLAFGYFTLPEGFLGGTTLHLVDNPGGNVPSQYSGNYVLLSDTKFYGTLTIDAGSELDLLNGYIGGTASFTNNGTVHSWATMWGNTSAAVLNNGSTTRTRGDTFYVPPTVNAGASFLYQATGYNATEVANSFLATGATSGTVSILPQAAAGTYNFNLPTTAGTSGYFLTSAGGAGSPMTWTNPTSITPTFSGLTTDGVMYATSSSAIASTAAGTSGQIMVSQGGGGSAPLFSSTVSAATTFSAASTALTVTNNAQVTGQLGVGGAVQSGTGAYVTGSIVQTGDSTTQNGVRSNCTYDSTGEFRSYYADRTIKAGVTATTGKGLNIDDIVLLSGAIVSNNIGVNVEDMSSGTLIAAYQSQITSGTGKWGFYGTGNANNAMAGSLKLGATSTPAQVLDVSGNGVISGGLTVGGAVFQVSSAGNGKITNGSTSAAHLDFLNTGNSGGVSVGAESSTGGSLFTGSTAYAAVFGTSDSTPTQFFTHNHLALNLDPNQNTITQAGFATVNYDTSTATSGTIAASANKPGLLITGAGGTTLTIKLPSSPIDGQLYWVASQGTFTTITWQDAAGTAGNVIGGQTAIGGTARGQTFVYSSSATKWFSIA